MPTSRPLLVCIFESRDGEFGHYRIDVKNISTHLIAHLILLGFFGPTGVRPAGLQTRGNADRIGQDLGKASLLSLPQHPPAAQEEPRG